MKRILALVLLISSLTGMGPAQRRVATCGPMCSQSRLDTYIIAHGPTLFHDPNNLQYVTYDSSNRVSVIASRVGAITFTQSTDANKPILSRPDRVENLLKDSGDLSAATYTGSGSTFSGNTLTSTATTTYHARYNDTGNRPFSASGFSWRIRVEFEYTNAANIGVFESTGNWDGVSFNAQTCAYQNKTASVSSYSLTPSAGRCILEFVFTQADVATGVIPYICINSTASLTGCESYLAAGTETVKIHSAQIQRSSMQSTYIATTTAPVYGSLTGRRMLTFDGSTKALSSASLASALFTASTKEYFQVAALDTNSGSQTVMRSASGYFYIQTSSGSIYSFNYDGTTDSAGAAFTVGAPFVFYGRHESGTLYGAVNRGAAGSNASGDTSNINTALFYGSSNATGSTSVNGQLGPIIAFSRILPQAVRDTIGRGESKFNLAGQ